MTFSIDEHKSLAFLRHTLGLVYTLVLLSVGIATSIYFAMSGDTSQRARFHEVFFFLVYLSGLVAAAWLAVYMWRHRGARFHSQRRQIRLESLMQGHRLAGAAPPPLPHDDCDPTDRGAPYVAHCGEGFNAYLRAGLLVFTAGTVALDLLYLAAPHLDPENPACRAGQFKPVLYACQLAFAVALCGLLAAGHRAVFLRHRGMATALLGHELAACLCLWAHSSVAEISESVLGASARPAGANATTPACPAGRRALDTAGPYLSPAKVEFALLAGPMTLQLLAYIGDHRCVEAKQLTAGAPAGGRAEESVEKGEGMMACVGFNQAFVGSFVRP